MENPAGEEGGLTRVWTIVAGDELSLKVPEPSRYFARTPVMDFALRDNLRVPHLRASQFSPRGIDLGNWMRV